MFINQSDYGFSRILYHGNTPLQEYGFTSNVLNMEFKDRLKTARKNAGLTQTALAAATGIDQTSISDLERGKSQSTSYVAKIATICGVSPIWLADGIGEMLDSGNVGGSPSEKDYALIPQYSAKGDCGEGYLNGHTEINGGLVFKREWLKKIGSKPENLLVIYAQGDSMEPFIFEGDVVLFDTSETEPKHKQVYVIRRPDGSISIKRLNQLMSGAWIIKSDNPAHDDEQASEETISNMPILGRVIWRGGEMW